MSDLTFNIEFNSTTNISSATGYSTTTHASKTSAAQQPLAACYCYPSYHRPRQCGGENHSISEITVNNTIYSDETTQKRRVVRCKDTNDEEMLTYHLKLKPESLHYTFSTTEPKKISFYTEKHLDYQGTSGTAYHSRINEPSSHKSSITQHSQNEKAKSFDEKTTYCSPVLKLNTAEFVERTINKNNKLKHLVREIVEAREQEKKLAWINYLNELKNKYSSNNCEPKYVPEQDQIKRNHIFNHFITPCRCDIWPCSGATDDYYDALNTSDYLIINSFPNEILCYPISSAARKMRSKNKTTEQLRRQYAKTEYTIHEDERNPRREKRKQLSDSQLRNISAQTGTGIDSDSYQTKNCVEYENKVYEPCVRTACNVHTNTDKLKDEKGTVADLEKSNASLRACFCKKDQGTLTKNISSIEIKKTFEASEVDTFLRDLMKKDQERDMTDFQMKNQDGNKDLWINKKDILNNSESKKDNIFFSFSAEEDVRNKELDDSSERKEYELKTYESLTENMTKLKEHLGEPKSNDDSLGVIEEKLDIIISTMNDLLTEVKLRMLHSADKFDNATSTVYSNKSEECCCIAHNLLEKEINIPKTDSNIQKEIYNMDLFKSDNTTKSMFQPYDFSTSKNLNQFNSTLTRTELNMKIDDLSTITTKQNMNQLDDFPTSTRNVGQSNYLEQLNSTPHRIENNMNLDSPSTTTENMNQLDLFPTSTKNMGETNNSHQLNSTTEQIENINKLNNLSTTTEKMKHLDAFSTSTKNMGHSNSINTPINNTEANNTNLEDLNAFSCTKSNIKEEVSEKIENQSVGYVAAAQTKKIQLNPSENKSENHMEKPAVTPQVTNGLSPTVIQSFVDLKRESDSFIEHMKRSRLSLTAAESSKLSRKNESVGQWLKAKLSPRILNNEKKLQITSVPEENEGTENPELNQLDNNKNSGRKTKDQELCCAHAKMKNTINPRYRHASVSASLGPETSYNAEKKLLEDVNYSNSIHDERKINKRWCILVDRVVSKIDENIMKTSDKSNSTKMRIVIDRAVSKINESFLSGNHQQNHFSVDCSAPRIDDIIKQEINKSNQAKKDINELLNKEFTNNCGVERSFHIPTKERATEVTDSLSITRVSNSSSSQGKQYDRNPSSNNYGVQISFDIQTKERATEVTDSLSITRISNSSSSQSKQYDSNPSRRTPLTIAAVNTDPMSLLCLFQLSTYTVRQLLTFINFDYSSYLPTVSRALPAVSEAVQYLCHICGATFTKPSKLCTHMKIHKLDSAKDCCVCRHLLKLRQHQPGVFACQFCGQRFTRAYCRELHERGCARRAGRRLDVSDSRAILT